MQKIILFILTIFQIGLLGQSHFVPVSPTGLPYHLVFTNLTIDNRQIRAGEEVGIFSGNLCVGAAQISQNGQTNVSVVTWQGDSSLNVPGFKTGDTIRVKVWVSSFSKWIEVYGFVQYSVGNGIFGNGSFSSGSLTAYTGLAPIINVTPTNIDFGALQIGQSTNATITIKNTGNANLTINSIQSNNSQFYVSQYQGAVAPNGSVNVVVTFSPNAANYINGKLTVYSDAPQNPSVEINLEGQGLPQQNPVITVNPSSLNFGNVRIGNVSSQNIVIKNEGTSELSIYNIVSTSSKFKSLSSNFTVAAGESKSVTVTYSPTQSAIDNASMTIYNNSSNSSSFQVSLSGRGVTGFYNSVPPTGLPYTIILSDIDIDGHGLSEGDEVGLFDSTLCVGIAVFNGTLPLVITAWEKNSELNLPGFTPGDSIKVKIYATTYGTRFDLLPAVKWVAGNGLYGFGTFSEVILNIKSGKEPKIEISRDFVNFGDVSINEFKNDTIRVFNKGLTNLQITSISSGNNVFSATPQTIFVAPNSSSVITLRFSPQQMIPYLSEFTINSNDPLIPTKTISCEGVGIPQNFTLLQVDTSTMKFPQTRINDTSVVILNLYNAGSAPISFYNVNTQTPNEFVVSENSFIINGGSSHNLKIIFKPKSVFLHQTVLNLSNTSQNMPNLSIKIRGLSYENFLNGVNPTGLPYIITVDTLTKNNAINVVTGDEIGVFDGEICAGVFAVGDTGKVNITSWEENPDEGLPGFNAGNSIVFKYYAKRNNLREVLKVNPVYLAGNGLFGTKPFSRVNLTVTDTVYPPEKIKLKDPGNSASELPRSILFRWYKNPLATSYRIQVASDSLFGSIIVNEQITDTVKYITGLNYYTRYYWRVSGTNRGGSGQWSDLWEFLTIIEKPVKVVMNSPENNKIDVKQPIELRWLGAERAARYIIEVSLSSTFSNPLLSDTLVTDTVKSMNNLAELQKYYWRVCGINAGGSGDWSDIWDFTTYGKPSKVTLSSPPDNAINQPINLQLQWNKGLRTDNYTLCVSTDPNYQSIYLTDTLITDTLKQLSNLSKLTKYYWRIKGVNVLGDGEWSNTRSFTTITEKPGAVELISPEDGDSISTQPITLVWKKALRGEIYTVQLSGDSLFSTLTAEDTTLTDTLKQLAQLETGDYYWRVNSRNTGGISGWSEAYKFTVSTICKVIKLQSGWNIVSIPVKSQNMNTQVMFPNFTSPTYGYQNGYQTKTILESGKGYWIRYLISDSIEICGEQIEYDTIALASGWNLIGIYEKDINKSSIITTPANIINSFFYEYNNGYTVPGVLTVGKGYWVRTSQSGVINIPTGYLSKRGNEEEAGIEINPEWGRMTVIDSRGRGSTLYLSEGKENLSRYELPPVPPEGIFDVRFSTDRLLEDISTMQEIVIKSAEYPVELGLEGLEGLKALVVKVERGSEKVEKRLKDGETILFSEGSRIFIETVEIPKEFGLSQNYPNPFNPSTVIRYQLPFEGKVTIKLYDILGKEVGVLVDEVKEAGSYSQEINITSKGLSSGVYFYEMRAGEFRSVKKMVLMK